MSIRRIIKSSIIYRMGSGLMPGINIKTDIFNNSLIIKCLARISGIFKKLPGAVTITAIFAALAGFYVSWQLGALLITALFAYYFCFIAKKPGIILAFLIFALPLSPKVSLGVIYSQPIYIRVDDVLILFLALFLFLGDFKNNRRFVNLRLDALIILYLLFAVISTTRGIFIGTISKPFISLFYLFKMIEYFLIFYIFLNLIRSKKEAKFYIILSLVSSLCVAIYGIWEHLHPLDRIVYPLFYRIYERGYFYGQANHFGAYLVFFISIAVALGIFLKEKKKQLVFILLAIVLAIALAWTYSRQAYIALFLSIISLCLFRDKKIPLFILILILLSPFLLHTSVWERIAQIKDAFLSNDIYSSSWARRIGQWKLSLETFKDYPLMGIGIGARHRVFYESQVVMVLSELGIIGLLAFLALPVIIFRDMLNFQKTQQGLFIKAAAIGFIAGFIGILVQSFVSVTFIITTIIGPFWVICASLYYLKLHADA